MELTWFRFSQDAAFILPGKEEMREKRKVCGTCNWCRQEVPFGEFYCENSESDCYGCECMYDDYCMDYEERNRNA